MPKHFFKCHWDAFFLLAFFSVYFAICISIRHDYGFGIDEILQRQHALVAYKYINEVLFDRKIPQLNECPCLPVYRFRYYGVALQLLGVIYEDFHGFSLSIQDVLMVRRIGIFSLCFIGYVFFYFALKEMFKSSKFTPIFGTMFIMLYPRYFALQLVDVKNLVFASTFMVTLFFMVKAVNSNSYIWQFLFGCVAAIATNTRMMAIILPTTLLAYYVLDDLASFATKSKTVSWRILCRYCCVTTSFFITWYIITPVAWLSPSAAFADTFSFFSNFTPWGGTMVFMGRRITCADLPWYYLFVWLGITIPIYLIFLFLVGHFAIAKALVSVATGGRVFDLRSILSKVCRMCLQDCKWSFCALLLFWGSVFAVIFLHCRIYIGWHHLYYVFVPFCVLSCLGLDYLISFKRLKRIVVRSLIALLLLQSGWMAYNHPYQPCFFNLIGKPFAQYFDRDEMRVCQRNSVKWILLNDDDKTITVFPGIRSPVSILYNLSHEESQRISQKKGFNNTKYFICTYRNIIGNNYKIKGYNEVYSAYVDGYKVSSVFRKRSSSRSSSK